MSTQDEQGGGNGERVSSAKKTSPGNGTDLTGIFKQVDPQEGAATQSAARPASNKGSATDLFATVRTPEDSKDPSFTRMFESLRTQDSSRGASASQPSHNTADLWTKPSRPESEPSPSSPGEFTRLLQRSAMPLGQEPAPEPGYGCQPSFRATPEFGGGFTQLLRALSSETNAPLPEVSLLASAPEFPQSAPDGPGEFTRIISRSALREAESTPLATSERAVQQSQPTQTSAGPAPGAMPAAASAAVTLMHEAARPQSLPATPSLPSAAATAPQIRVSGLQAYVPLLLLANLFAMFILILMAGFLLFHHR